MDLHDVVELTTDLPEEGLNAGSIGAIVDIFKQPTLAYEVEFVDSQGKTIAMVTLEPYQIRAASS